MLDALTPGRSINFTTRSMMIETWAILYCDIVTSSKSSGVKTLVSNSNNLYHIYIKK